MVFSIRFVENLFQLTRLMRGVTLAGEKLTMRISQFQLTRLMRGVTTEHGDYTKWLADFNSHASCEA